MNFREIVGHERPVAILTRALANNALAHALLFSGEEGIGKKATAQALAAAVQCREQGAAGGCGHCNSCRKAAAGNHPDVHLETAEGDEIKIDQIRQIQADLSLRPFEGESKVLIVDGAERMNSAAANAFLKTLEEPPGESLIILVSAMPHSLLPTIRSRCQEIKFQPLARPALAAVLQERRGLSADDAWFAAALSRGSIGRALTMDVEAEKTAREEFTAQWLDIGRMPATDVLALAESLGKDRDRFDAFLDLGVEWLRDILVYQETHDERLLVYGGRKAAAQERTRLRTLRELGLLEECRRMLDRRASGQLTAEHLLMTLAEP